MDQTRHCDACGREIPMDYQTARTHKFEHGTADGTTVTVDVTVESPFGGSDVCTDCLITVVREGVAS